MTLYSQTTAAGEQGGTAPRLRSRPALGGGVSHPWVDHRDSPKCPGATPPTRTPEPTKEKLLCCPVQGSSSEQALLSAPQPMLRLSSCPRCPGQRLSRPSSHPRCGVARPGAALGLLFVGTAEGVWRCVTSARPARGSSRPGAPPPGKQPWDVLAHHTSPTATSSVGDSDWNLSPLEWLQWLGNCFVGRSGESPLSGSLRVLPRAKVPTVPGTWSIPDSAPMLRPCGWGWGQKNCQFPAEEEAGAHRADSRAGGGAPQVLALPCPHGGRGSGLERGCPCTRSPLTPVPVSGAGTGLSDVDKNIKPECPTKNYVLVQVGPRCRWK